MKEMTVQELKALRDQQADVHVIDVREPYEYEIMNLGGQLIPMAEIMNRVDEIPRDRTVVLHCRTGKRAAAIVDTLERVHGFSNLHNLVGGAFAWAEEIDPSLELY